MDDTRNRMTTADALVIFGVTGDLTHKMIFPALYAMARRGILNVPVVGVAAPKWSLTQLRKRATDSIRQAGKIDDRDALDHLLSLLRYVGGDYSNHHLTAQHSDQPMTDAPGSDFNRNNTQPMGCCGI